LANITPTKGSSERGEDVCLDDGDCDPTELTVEFDQGDCEVTFTLSFVKT
jgi:hypothetical protein